MKRRVISTKQITDNKFLNLHEFLMKDEKGDCSSYYVASRNKNPLENKNKADAVCICATHHGKLVLIKQYRPAINDYIYELPAGLIDKGEDFYQAGIREFKEETGLNLDVIKNDIFSKPFFNSVGMTDESSSIIFGYASGDASNDFLEKYEEIEVIFANENEVKRILKEENVSTKCAYMMINYLNFKNRYLFDFLKGE